MRSNALLIGSLLALLAGPAAAQQGGAVTIAGTVEKLDADVLTVKPDSGGAAETIRLAPNFLVVQNKPAALADIKPNDFVASAAVRKEDGKLHSTELRIFPEAMRGLGEGQRPMNDPRNQVMTNATVTGAAIVSDSNNLKVRFPGGESELIVDPGVPVTRIDTADKALLKPGAKVRLRATRGNGGLTAGTVTLQ